MAKRPRQENDGDVFHYPVGNKDLRFQEVFLEYHAALVLYAYRITDDQAIAEDIASEVFVNLWRRNEGSEQIQSLKSYLYKATRNRALTWIKTNKRQNKHRTTAAATEENSERPAIDNIIYAETMRGIYAAMDRLPTQCRKVFILHFIEGKRIREVADELKISISSVRTHKGRGIELLQKALLSLLFFLLIHR